MELWSSSPHSQAPTTCPYPQPDQSNPSLPAHFLKIHSTPRSCKWSLTFKCPHQNPVCTSAVSHTTHNYIYVYMRIHTHILCVCVCVCVCVYSSLTSFILCSEFRASRVQTRFCQRFPYHIKGLAGLPQAQLLASGSETLRCGCHHRKLQSVKQTTAMHFETFHLKLAKFYIE